MSRNKVSSEVLRLRVAEERETTGLPSPFKQISQRMFDVLGDGGILKEVVHPGEGPPIPQNASVLIHYSGFLEYSDHPFETTTKNRYPPMMKLGKDVTLVGLELGLLTMQKGEFSRFLFLPKYAYGDLGCQPVIPPAATVLFEVQILDYLDSGKVDDFIAMSPEGQNTVPITTLLEVVDTVRNFGNLFFKKSRFYNAKDRYKQAVTLLENRNTYCELDKERINAALLPVYLNLSLTELRLENPQKALKYSQNALNIDSANTKALYRSGQAYMELSEYENAENCLLSAQAKKPFDSDINNLLKKVATSKQETLDKEKDLYSKMFGKPNQP